MQKSKNDQTPKSSLKRVAIYVAAAIIFLFTLWALNVPQLPDKARSVLPPELVPTAEYLLDQPLPTSPYLMILPPYHTDRNTTKICIPFDKYAVRSGPEDFMVNGAHIPKNAWIIAGRHEMYTSDLCIDVFLDTGLHLMQVEFQPVGGTFEGPLKLEWAIEVK